MIYPVQLQPFQPDIIPVEQDENGMIPELLLRALEERYRPEDAFRLHKGVPKVISKLLNSVKFS